MQEPSVVTFDSRDYFHEDRISAFREMTASVYDTHTLDNGSDFMVKTFGYHVNNFLFIDFKCGPAQFKHTQRHLQGNAKDFLVLHAQLSDQELLQMKHGIIRLLPNNL